MIGARAELVEAPAFVRVRAAAEFTPALPRSPVYLIATPAPGPTGTPSAPGPPLTRAGTGAERPRASAAEPAPDT